MPWIRRENILRHYLFETKSFKTEQAKFCMKFYLTIILRKIKLSLGTQISSHRVRKQPRKLTARCPNNVDSVTDSVERSLKKSLRKRSQEFGFSLASLQTQNLNQA